MNPFKYLIMIPFGWILKQLYLLVGSYGWSLILFSLLVTVILLPMRMKSKKSMLKMNRLGPKLKVLQEQYAGDNAKLQQATAQLYKDEGVSMFGGCLWSLIPMLILIPLYYVIRAPLTYIMGLSADQITQVIDVLAKNGVTIDTNHYYYQVTAAGYIHQFYDQISAVVPKALDIKFMFLGIDLSRTPHFSFWNDGFVWKWSEIGLWLIPFASGLSQFFSAQLTQRLNGSVATDDKGEKDKAAAQASGKSMKMMLYLMPLFSVYIGYQMSAGISIYWIAQAVINFAQEAWLTHHYRKAYDAEDALKREKAAEEAALEAERERRREERKALGVSGTDANTSKKKQEAKQRAEEAAKKAAYEAEKAAKKAAEAAARGEVVPTPEPEEVKEEPALSGDPERPYCRGRAYKPNRYGRNTQLPREENAAKPAEPEKPAEEADDPTHKATFKLN